MELGFAPTIPRSIPFALKLFPHDFGGICEDWIQPVLENHDFRFSPHTPPSHKINPKHQNHGTWLCTNHAKINFFCSQSSPTSLCRHLWRLSPTSFAKQWFSFFTAHTFKSQNQAKRPKSWTLQWTNHAKLTSTCSQTFTTLLWGHFWGLSPASFPKPWLSCLTPDWWRKAQAHHTMKAKLPRLRPSSHDGSV